jgi:hypothetical protein
MRRLRQLEEREPEGIVAEQALDIRAILGFHAPVLAENLIASKTWS